MSGWIGVDFDGTIAEYHGWNGGELGRPIPAMIDRVKGWLQSGTEVRIFTARVGACGETNDIGQTDNQKWAEEQRWKIEDWCLRHIGQKLRVTASKDFGMIELYDDRAFRVEMNTGKIL